MSSPLPGFTLTHAEPESWHGRRFLHVQATAPEGATKDGDVRATFRFTTEADLVTLPNGDHPTLDSWEASAAVGYEF